MTQQTAVGYIISQLRQLAFNESTHLGMGDVRVTQGLIDELEERGKQMEKEQCKQDYDSGLFDGTMDDVKDRLYKNAQQYYNETYGNKS